MTKGWLAGIAAALMLFAQFAIAAQECDGLMADAGCHTHCLQQDQQDSSLDHHAGAVIPFPPRPAADFARAETRGSVASQAAEQLPGGPPLRVLFCSYRN